MFKFKKTVTLSVAALLAASSVLGLVACGGGGDETDIESGKGGGGGKTTTIQFWGSGDADEKEVFGTIVDEFNRTIGKEKGINVKYSGEHGDVDANALQLSSSNPPDVIYVPDRQFKLWASSGYLENLTDTNGNPKADYEGLDEFLAPGAVWDQALLRYRYDLATANSTPTSALWALPKDIGPTVLYYNRVYLERMGITHLSLDVDEAKAAGYPEKGYFEKDEKWYFNNRIPMSWEETTELALRFEEEIGPDYNKGQGKVFYGYFTEWWFNYGFGVGGNCVEYVSEGEDSDHNPMGYYKFTLNDETPNWIVKDDEPDGIDVTTDYGTNHYGPGEIISYMDKTDESTDFDATKQAKCNQLPSMYDAFLEFCALTAYRGEEVGTNSKDEKVLGKYVSMGAESIGTQSARDRFAAGTLGMFVGLRAEVTHLRKRIGSQGSWMVDQDSWDVAPLPVYKEYDADGNVLVHGVPGGHSGSMGLAIARGSKNKKAAWELVKYVAGVPGQSAQAERGFCIPNQIEVAKSDVFLQPTLAPKNAQVFVDAAQYETAADWWYLKDWLWIDDWANCLNYEVREPNSSNSKTVLELFRTYGGPTQEKLYKYTYNSHNLSAKP